MQNGFAEPTREQARKTALVVAVVLILIAAFGWYRGRMTLAYITGAAALILIFNGLFVPPLAKFFHVWWMHLAFALGYVNSRILRTIIYFLVFVPYGLVSRLFRRDPLRRRAAKAESYWIPREETRQAREQFERMF
jgi:hypothetical protein